MAIKEKIVEIPLALEPAPLATRPTLLGTMRAAFNKWWLPEITDLHQKSSNEMSEIRTGLATTRTLMAADRTLMAWVRTALSLNSFGFTIYKLLQGFQQAGGVLPQGDSPRNIGLFLTGLGTLAMVMGTVEYWHTLRELRQLQAFRLARPSLIMALLMSAMGLFLFFSIIAKLF